MTQTRSVSTTAMTTENVMMPETPAPISKKRIAIIAAAVGGACGALSVLFVVAAIFVLRRRRLHHHKGDAVVTPLAYDAQYSQPSEKQGLA